MARRHISITSFFSSLVCFASYLGCVSALANDSPRFGFGITLETQSLAYSETSSGLNISTININPAVQTRIRIAGRSLYWDTHATYTVFSTRTPTLGTFVATSGLTLYLLSQPQGLQFGLGGGGAYFKHLTDTIFYGIQSVYTAYGQVLLHWNTKTNRSWQLNSRLIMLSQTQLGLGTNSIWSSEFLVPLVGSSRPRGGLSLIFSFEKAGFSMSTVAYSYSSTAYAGGLRFVY